MGERVENIENAFSLKGYKIYTESILEKGHRIYFLANDGLAKYLASDDPRFHSAVKKIAPYTLYKKTHLNAQKLRRLFKHLTPTACGTRRSFGFGDRLGMATPGHIQALKGRDIFPVFAQQSIREMERTCRTMKDVLDDAVWGVFQTGYRRDYGADIDHVKKEEDVQRACECGYTMYTIDPSDYVNNLVKDMSIQELISVYNHIPDRQRYEKLYLDKRYKIGNRVYKIDKVQLATIVLIYAEAIKHIIRCYNIIKRKVSSDFDFEASVDETATTTTPLAHIFIVEELRRNNVKFTSLALRFVGEFEKGIDYLGDLTLFQKEFRAHVAISKYFGGYKLSIHSGSDKFSIYPIIGKDSGGLFHIKTSGTSWLEAVRLISQKNPRLYRCLHRLALANFEKDRQSYHVTTALSRIPDLKKLADEQLPELLNKNNARQLMHITYGSLLKIRREEIYDTLNSYEKRYYQLLVTHMGRHLELTGITLGL